MQRKMTIDDIAKKAGVGRTTVSRVLNNTGYVNEKTREKIEEVIRACDYVPSAAARNFVKQDSNMIGVIVPEAHNPYFASALEGIYEVLEEKELLLVLCNSNKDFNKEEKILKLLKQQKLKGLIITPAIDDLDVKKIREYKNLIKSLKVPVTFMDSGLDFYDWDTVYFDNMAGAYNATKTMLERGYKDIGIITGDLDTKTARDRYKGYLRAFEEYDLEPLEENIFHGDFTTKTAYEITRKMLEKEKFPETVFTTNNLTTIGFIKAVYDAKKILGTDIRCISFDKVNTFEDLKYSYIERDPREMGHLVATMLMERIADIGVPPRKCFMPSEIRINL